MSIDNFFKCITRIPFTSFSFAGTACELVTGQGNDNLAAVCNPLLEGATALNSKGAPSFSQSPVSGSLVGMYHTVNNLQKNAEPAPNLAFFASQEFKSVPFVGKALAQTDGSYKSMFISQVYFAWKLLRNLAFGMMALIMLIIGITMINRTKVSSQTIVTIQYALPKVIIAVVLIAFSYPIAATLTNLFFQVSIKAPLIVDNTVSDQLAYDMSSFLNDGQQNFIYIMFYAISSGFQLGVTGPVFLIVWLVCIVVLLIQRLILLIKWIATYAKMLLEIVLSPIDLVMSAVPGSEDSKSGESKVITWFKKFLAYGLSLIVLTALPNLVSWVALYILIGSIANPAESSFSAAAGGTQISIPSLASLYTANAGFGITMYFIITIMGFSMASKLPGQIQYMLMGDPAKSRDKK